MRALTGEAEFDRLYAMDEGSVYGPVYGPYSTTLNLTGSMALMKGREREERREERGEEREEKRERRTGVVLDVGMRRRGGAVWGHQRRTRASERP